jgi:predicted DNA-binding protein
MSEELRERLEAAAHRLNKGKSWIVKQAIKEYLDRHNEDWLRAEARRQSSLASRKEWSDGALWEEATAEVWAKSNGKRR